MFYLKKNQIFLTQKRGFIPKKGFNSKKGFLFQNSGFHSKKGFLFRKGRWNIKKESATFQIYRVIPSRLSIGNSAKLATSGANNPVRQADLENMTAAHSASMNGHRR